MLAVWYERQGADRGAAGWRMPDHEPGAADSDLAWSAILAKFAYTD
jgi:hypothetical protein